MIWESGPWKDHLAKTAKQIAKWRTQTRWTEASLVKIEKEIFFGFYAIRKLLETKTKISFEARDTQTSIRVYKAKSKKADLMNWHKLDELYDFSESKRRQVCLYDLCNYFIHSYVFVAKVDSSGFHSILFNTDRERTECLLEIDAQRLQKVFELIGSDQVNSAIMLRGADGEWQIVKASRKKPKQPSGLGEFQ